MDQAKNCKMYSETIRKLRFKAITIESTPFSSDANKLCKVINIFTENTFFCVSIFKYSNGSKIFILSFIFSKFHTTIDPIKISNKWTLTMNFHTDIEEFIFNIQNGIEILKTKRKN